MAERLEEALMEAMETEVMVAEDLEVEEEAEAGASEVAVGEVSEDDGNGFYDALHTFWRSGRDHGNCIMKAIKGEQFKTFTFQ